MNAAPGPVDAGHAFYTKRTLAIYDVMILGFFSRMAWKCPSTRILQHYDDHVTANHLDIGVGTGYFLDRCRFETDAPRVALMDLNVDCLEKARSRIARYDPEVYTANVLEPLTFDVPGFDSVGMNYLLHCIPGSIAAKAVAFEHVKALVNPGGIVFGATLLHDGVPRNRLARQVMARNNRHGIFSNTDDSLEGLRAALEEHLTDSAVEVVGCVGIFSGTV